MSSSLLLTLAITAPGFHPLAWLTLLPFAFALRKRPASFELYLGAFCGGLFLHLAAFDWIRTSYGGQGMSGPKAMSWLWHGLLWSPVWPVTLWYGRHCCQKLPMTIALPAVWVASEFLRYQLGWLVFWTPFPWVQLGATQAALPALIQVADLAGVWAISFLVAMASGAVHDLMHGKWLGAALCVALILADWCYGAWRLAQIISSPGPVVCLMPESPLPNGAINAPPADLLVWSESVVPGDLDESRIQQLVECARSTRTCVAVGCHRVLNLQTFNSIAFADPRSFQGCYDKQYLVPYSEFSPWGIDWIGGPSQGLTPGNATPIFNCGNYRIGLTVCYDIGFARLFRSFMAQRPDFFLACSKEAADPSGQLARQLADLTKFRAIETRRAIVRNVDGGFSGITDSAGRLIAWPENPEFQTPVVLGRVPIDHRTSLYSCLGDWLAWLCGLSVAIVLLGKR